jgi:hypothetical protein
MLTDLLRGPRAIAPFAQEYESFQVLEGLDPFLQQIDHFWGEFIGAHLVAYHPATAPFDVPANQEKGLSLLEVVTNGVASEPVEVMVK